MGFIADKHCFNTYKNKIEEPIGIGLENRLAASSDSLATKTKFRNHAILHPYLDSIHKLRSIS